MIEAVKLWNEPNNQSHWDFHVDPRWEQFSAMAGGAARRIRALAPGLPIVLAITLTRKEPRYDDRGTRQTVSRPDGSRLHVVVDGPPDGPTLIFSHGWGLSSGDWYYVKRDLAARYRIMTWDLAGLGHSTRANDGDQSLEKMADDLAAVLDATCPAGPAILVGHSIGGMITQVFCRRHAARLGTSVVGLVLAETTYINPLRTAVGAPLWKALEKPLIVPLNYLTIGLAPLAWISNWQSYLNGSMHLSSRLTSFAGRQTLGQVDYLSLLLACAWPATSARGNLAMLTLDTTDVLPTIPVPVLVVAGWHDLLTRHQAGVEMARLIPGAELVTLDPGGHMGHWENHPDFLPALTAFVDRISKTTT